MLTSPESSENGGSGDGIPSTHVTLCVLEYLATRVIQWGGGRDDTSPTHRVNVADKADSPCPSDPFRFHLSPELKAASDTRGLTHVFFNTTAINKTPQ